MIFEVGKLYLTRDKKVRRVVCVDTPGKYPIVSVAVTDDEPELVIFSHMKDGRFHEHAKYSERDLLIEYNAPREWLIHPLGDNKPRDVASMTAEEREEYGWVHVREVLPRE